MDLSTSLTPTDRDRQQARLRELTSALDFGDRLVLLKAHADGVKNDTSAVRELEMPEMQGAQPLQSEVQELELRRTRVERVAAALFKTAPVTGTDLLSTIHTAADQARGRTHTRTVLVLLSDMLHCADTVCIEPPRDVPDSAWIAARAQKQLVPRLNGTCIVVVGADDSTEHGVRVREFWRRYFRAAGADFSDDRYAHAASSAAMLGCGTAGGEAPATAG